MRRWLSLWVMLVGLSLMKAASGQALIVPGSFAYTGAPFTARMEMRWEGTDAQAGGTRKSVMMRDSAGRERFEDGSGPAMKVTLFDPATGKYVRLDGVSNVARVTQVKAQAPESMREKAAQSRDCRVAPGWESLGIKDVAGLEACGQKLGEREYWRSTTYLMPVLEVRVDSRLGRLTRTLVEFQQGEPDAALFAVPEGYEVQVQAPPAAQPASPDGVERMGSGVTAPVPLVQPEPKLSDAEAARKVNGNVLVYLIIDEEGAATHVRVLRGLGSGADMAAVEAVRKYRFRPAMKDGKPVKVELNVEVTFRSF